MKICLFWQNYGPYHFARLEALRRLCDARGHEVTGIEVADRTSTYGWRRAEFCEPGVVTLFPGAIAEQVSPWAVRRAARKLLEAEECDVIFTPSYWPLYSVLVACAARSQGVRLVMMNESHGKTGNNSLLALAIKRSISSMYDAAFVGGTVHRQFHQDLGFRDEYIFEGYDAVDNTLFAAKADQVRRNEAHWRARLGLPHRFILNIGRFIAKKNLTTLIRAFASAHHKGWLNGCDLVLVGGGPEKEKLQVEAKKAGLEIVEGVTGRAVAKEGNPGGAVRFYPFAQIEDVAAYYALAQCFVLPSIYEEWGLVVNEAMASGCAVGVSSVVGCAQNLVVPDRTGFSFDPQQPGQLAEGLRVICHNPASARQLGANARAHINGWSCANFAENCLWEADRARATPRRSSRTAGRGRAKRKRSVVLLQTCFPDYREPVFDEINRRLKGDFELVCGNEYFTADVKICSKPKPWRAVASNTFFFSRNLLWQSGAIGRVCAADTALLELNPRALSSWIILAVRKMTGSPTLLWGHVWARDGVAAWTNSIRLIMMRLADGIIPYTHTQGEELKRRLKGRLIVTAPNSLVPQDACKASILAIDRTTDIIFAGRMKSDKKPRLLLEAFKLALPRLGPEAKLRFVGEGPESVFLKRLVEEYGLAPRVFFHGHVNDAESLRAIYSSVLCGVSPGYVGLTAIQAFAHGVPMLIADREPHSPEIEACIEGSNTRFFASDDPNSLAEKICEMWRNREHWWGRRPEIANWVKENYSVETMVDGFEAGLQGVTANRK